MQKIRILLHLTTKILNYHLKLSSYYIFCSYIMYKESRKTLVIYGGICYISYVLYMYASKGLNFVMRIKPISYRLLESLFEVLDLSAEKNPFLASPEALLLLLIVFLSLITPSKVTFSTHFFCPTREESLFIQVHIHWLFVKVKTKVVSLYTYTTDTTISSVRM